MKLEPGVYSMAVMTDGGQRGEVTFELDGFTAMVLAATEVVGSWARTEQRTPVRDALDRAVDSDQEGDIDALMGADARAVLAEMAAVGDAPPDGPWAISLAAIFLAIARGTANSEALMRTIEEVSGGAVRR